MAVAAELYRCFGGRRVRGSWYRLTAAEVREALGRRATREAPARAAAAAAAPERRIAPRPGKRRRARTEKQLAYERRRREERTRKQKRAATLLGQMTQQQAAAELGVSARTLRNWKTAPAFRRERERQHKRAARQQTAPPSSKLKPPARRDGQDNRRTGAPRPAARPQPGRPPAPPDRQQTIAEQTPAIDVEQAERDGPTVAAEEQAEAADPPRSPSTSPHDGVPIFPDTRNGRAARLGSRKLNNLPNSLLDYHDAKRGREPPAERHARERRDKHRPH